MIKRIVEGRGSRYKKKQTRTERVKEREGMKGKRNGSKEVNI